MHKLKLFPKLFALTCALMLGLVALIHTLIYSHFYRNTFREQEAAVSMQADILKQTLSGLDTLSVRKAIKAFSKHKQFSARLHETTNNTDLDLSPNFDFDDKSENNYIFVEEREIVSKEGEKLLVQVLARRDMVLAAQKDSFNFLPYTLVASILFSLLLAYFYSYIINRPIREIMQVTKKMSELDPQAKLLVKGQDEIAQLKKQINWVYAELLANIAHLEKKNKQMLEMEKLKVNFIRSASHELKTPLASLHVMLENMLYNIGDYQDKDKYLKLSLLKVDQLHAMLKAILTISRLEEAVPEQELALKDLSEQILLDNEVLCQSRKLQVHNELENATIALPLMAAEQVLRQLIGNAVQYTSDGGKIRLYEDADNLYIANTCRPLNDEEIKQSFELLPNVLASHSSGLGLFLVKNILTNYKLAFEFYRQPEGMCFKIKLR